MARLPRAAFAALPHIVVQQALPGVSLANDPEDAQTALALLREVAGHHAVNVHAYALLPERWCLVATPPTATALGSMMQAWSRRFAMGLNRRLGRHGTLWSGRYRASVFDASDWMLDAMLYVEQAAQTAEAPSSIAHHLGQQVDPLVADPASFWALGNTPFEREARYRSLLEQPLTSLRRSAIDAALRGGWALGSAAFVAALSEQTGRPLRPRPRGRPPKAPP